MLCVYLVGLNYVSLSYQSFATVNSFILFPFRPKFHTIQKVYLEPNQTSPMELYAKLVNGRKQLKFYEKISIVDVRLGSKYAFAYSNNLQNLQIHSHSFLPCTANADVYLLAFY